MFIQIRECCINYWTTFVGSLTDKSRPEIKYTLSGKYLKNTLSAFLHDVERIVSTFILSLRKPCNFSTLCKSVGRQHWQERIKIKTCHKSWIKCKELLILHRGSKKESDDMDIWFEMVWCYCIKRGAAPFRIETPKRIE